MSEQLESEQIAVAATEPSTSDFSAFAADAEMVAEFVTESREHLASIEEKLLRIEKNSSDMESINAVFRAVHTIKGLAGFLELEAIQSVAHEVETLLDHARCHRLTITPALVDTLFAGTDFVRVQIDGVQLHLDGGPPPQSAVNTSLILRIRDVGKSAAAQASGQHTDAQEGQAKQDGQRVDARVPDATAAIATTSGIAGDPSSMSLASGPSSARQDASPSPPPAPAAQETSAHSDELSVRIETAKLDHLMDIVGELVITQAVVSHNPQVTAIRDSRLVGDLALLSRITAEIQRVTTSMRMVPIGNQFQKTARVVRDLSRQQGKQIVMVTSGEDTELDKSVAEALAGPLLHMIRNSIDHGIETPEERESTGKDPVARIRLAAYHQSAQIVIEIADDGRGLNREKILTKATERGLIQPGVPISDADSYQLIFEPGFSTAEKVTGISGRGVGMDVVRRYVQMLRGRIDIQSEAGIGTTFLLKLPLTLAIIEGLVVAVGNSRYIVPLYAVTEIFCPSESQLSKRGVSGETVAFRDAELPIVRLHRSFDVTPRSQAITDGVLIATESHGKRFCIFVDEMLGKQELVIKSLGSALKDCAGLMGCAILSDGRVGLILDVDGIMR